MDRQWQIKRSRKGIRGIAGIPGSLAVMGLLLGLLFVFKEDFRTHPLALWTPLLILALLVPGVVLSIRSELKGAEGGRFLKRGEDLLYASSMRKSRVVRVEKLLAHKEGVEVVFLDEQGRGNRLIIEQGVRDLEGLLRELERRR